MSICRSCNAEVGDATFCPLCGTRQESFGEVLPTAEVETPAEPVAVPESQAEPIPSVPAEVPETPAYVPPVVAPTSSEPVQAPVAPAYTAPTPPPVVGTVVTPVAAPVQSTFTPPPVPNTGFTPPPAYNAGLGTPAFSGAPVPVDRPSHTGQLIFAIINTVLGVVGLCCYCTGLPSLVLGIIAIVTSVSASKAPSSEEAKAKLKTAMILNVIAVALIVLGIIFWTLLLIFNQDFWDSFWREYSRYY